MDNHPAAEVILQVVRGQRDWRDLSKLGITVTFEGNKTSVRNPPGIEALAGPEDIAAGLLAYRSDPEEMRWWARIIFAADFLHLVLDDAATGDILLNALWDASFGMKVSDAAFEVARQLLEPG